MNLPRQLTRAEAAACLVTVLERRGARFILRDDDTFRLDMDGMADVSTEAEAMEIAEIAFALSDEVRAVLRSQRTHH